MNLYRVLVDGTFDIIKDFYVSDIREEITCIEREGNYFQFAGRLGLLYVFDLAEERQIVVCRGHWREITHIKAMGQFTFTSSADKSVRLWEVTRGLQISLYLESLADCSSVISFDLRFDACEFVTLDLCQTLRVWQVDKDYLIKIKNANASKFHSNSHEVLRMYHVPKHCIP